MGCLTMILFSQSHLSLYPLLCTHMKIPCTEFNISAIYPIVSVMHKPLIRQELQESFQGKKFNLVKQKFPQALHTTTKKATSSFYFTNKAKGWTKKKPKYLKSSNIWKCITWIYHTKQFSSKQETSLLSLKLLPCEDNLKELRMNKLVIKWKHMNIPYIRLSEKTYWL